MASASQQRAQQFWNFVKQGITPEEAAKRAHLTQGETLDLVPAAKEQVRQGPLAVTGGAYKNQPDWVPDKNQPLHRPRTATEYKDISQPRTAADDIADLDTQISQEKNPAVRQGLAQAKAGLTATPDWVQGNLSEDDWNAWWNNADPSHTKWLTLVDFKRAAQTRTPLLTVALSSVPRPGQNDIGTIDLGTTKVPGTPGGFMPEMPVKWTGNLTDVANANEISHGRFGPYQMEVLRASAKYRVPWQLIWGIIQHESSWDPNSVGDNGLSHGLAQIYAPQHPEVTRAQADDPSYAIDWVAHNLYNHYYGVGGNVALNDWALAVLAHNWPAEAIRLKKPGTTPDPKAAAYIEAVFGPDGSTLNKLGFDFSTSDSYDRLGAGTSGKGQLQPPTFDAAGTRDQARQLFRKWYWREPTEAELDDLVGFAHGITVTNWQQNKAILAGYQTGGGAGAGVGAPDGKILVPLTGTDWKITGHFGDPREYRHGTHEGVDLAAAKGTPVVAAMGGTAKVIPNNGNGGNTVKVKGDDGRWYVYMHLDSFTIKDGDRIEAGAELGTVGSTGTSSGPHLHFEIREDNKGLPGQALSDVEDEVMGGQASTTPAVAESQAGGATLLADTNLPSSMEAQLRQQPEYQQLYAAKPGYQSEEEYGQQYADLGQQTLGQAPGSDLVRLGMQYGMDTFKGALAGPGQNSGTFRQRLLAAAQTLNQLT